MEESKENQDVLAGGHVYCSNAGSGKEKEEKEVKWQAKEERNDCKRMRVYTKAPVFSLVWRGWGSRGVAGVTTRANHHAHTTTDGWSTVRSRGGSRGGV
jgi:hypothetical protein